jgi:hypothetical protein
MLTDEQSAQVTMFMRVANHLQSNLHIIEGNAEVMDSLAKLKEAIASILDGLSEEERDSLLEQYKEEAELLGIYKGT